MGEEGLSGTSCRFAGRDSTHCYWISAALPGTGLCETKEEGGDFGALAFLSYINMKMPWCEKISVQLIAPFPDQFHAEKAMEVTQRGKIHRSVVLRKVCFLREGFKKTQN